MHTPTARPKHRMQLSTILIHSSPTTHTGTSYSRVCTNSLAGPQESHSADISAAFT
jgi:hypothetical protein